MSRRFNRIKNTMTHILAIRPWRRRASNFFKIASNVDAESFFGNRGKECKSFKNQVIAKLLDIIHFAD